MTSTVVITGASDGIGLAAARTLSRSDIEVVLVGRSPTKTSDAAAAIGADYLCCDFARLDDVRELASVLLARYPKIDVLANNAGGISGDHQITEDGYELTLQVNHLAPALLTTALLPRLVESKAIVIATSSSVNKMAKLDVEDLNSDNRYSPAGAYAVAKLANIMFTKELARRYSAEGLSPVSFEPGAVASNFAADSKGITKIMYHSILSKGIRKFMLSPAKGADTLVWLAETEPGRDWTVGDHYAKRRAIDTHRAANDEVLCKEIWERTATMIGGRNV